MIVDTHLHYSEPETIDRPYDPLGVDIGRPISADEALATASAAGVTYIIQVTPTRMGFDNGYALEGAARHPGKIGVFGRLDPSAANVRPQLEQWISKSYSVGVRLILAEDSTPPDFSVFCAPFWLACEELRIPVAVYAPNRARELGRLARTYGGLTVLADHCALTSRSRPSVKQWKDVLALEECPNIYMKVSYFPQIASDSYPFRTGQELMRDVYEKFGADRLMWGSNYPPALSVCSYEESVNFVRTGCGFIAPEDRRKILGETAERVLRLPR